MSTLNDTINDDFTYYLKNKDTHRKDTVGLLKTEISNWKSSKKNVGKEITDRDIIQIVKKQVEMRDKVVSSVDSVINNTIDQIALINYGNAKGKAITEIEYLKKYMPPSLNDSELSKEFTYYMEHVFVEGTNIKSAVNRYFNEKFGGRYESIKLNLLIDTHIK